MTHLMSEGGWRACDTAADWAGSYLTGVDCPECLAAAGLSGVGLIAAERQRQITVEGYKPEHDAEHPAGELVDAAVCYLVPRFHSQYWPWHDSFWKPTPDDRVRELVKAGALIAAEIDRLQS